MNYKYLILIFSDYQNGVNYSIPIKMNFLRTKNVKSDYDPVILS